MSQDARFRLRAELEELYALYAELLDDGPLEQWPELFCEQCDYRLAPRENVARGLPLAIVRCESRSMLKDRVRAVRETMVYEPRYTRHHITNLRVTGVDGPEIRTVANYSVIEVLRDELPRILNVGRYLDVIVRGDDGSLRFREKLCIYDSELVPNTIVCPV